jgi:small subunit ribosomal protein S16
LIAHPAAVDLHDTHLQEYNFLGYKNSFNAHGQNPHTIFPRRGYRLTQGTYGLSIEEIGRYVPGQDPSIIEINSERALYWLGVGAQPSEAVEALLKVTGDWQKFKGLPGTEGTLRVAAPKPSKVVAYEAAMKAAADEPAEGATTLKKKAQEKLAAKANPVVSEPEAIAEVAEVPAEDVTPEVVSEVVEAPAEAVVETPTEEAAAE